MRVRALLLGSIVLSLATSSACGDAAPEGGPPGGMQEMPPPEVSVVTIGAHRVALMTELPGRTAPFLVAEVRPQVGGLILKRLFTEGADVKAGDPLYEIDPASYEVALSMARANLQRAEAGLTTSSSRSRRYEALADGDAVSKQERDEASGGVRTSKADVAAMRAAVEAAKLDLERTKVPSPIAGRVGRSSAMPGTLVSPYQTSLVTVQQLDPIYVDITRSSVEVLRLKRALASGQVAKPGDGSEAAKVTLMLEDGTPYPHEGKLEFADVSVDPGTGAITLRAVFPNPDNDLLPGMYVRAMLEEGFKDNALLVPQQGVTRDPKGNAVALVVTKEGMVEPRILTVDRTIGDQWLVTAGIAAGDQVIVEGLQKVRPGAPAKPVPYDPNAKPGGAPPGAPGGAPPGEPKPDEKPGDKKPEDAKPPEGKPPEGKPEDGKPDPKAP